MNSPHTWQHSLAHSITDVKELCELLELDPITSQALLEKCDFPLRISREYVSRIEPKNPEDPLLKQILPIQAELIPYEGYTKDPLREQAVNPVPGLLHKYKSRVLLTVAGSCAINCRFCFRRHFPYNENNPGRLGWSEAIQYIAADPKIDEVILSGGDPLMLKDRQLTELIQELSQISSLRRLRIHTRLPIMIPSRITEELLDCLTKSSLEPIMVIHCNHPNELDSSVLTALASLRARQIALLNQSVLLKGINDELDILVKLSQTLFSAGVMPYYLHLLDRVEGTAHFAVSQQKAIDLVKKLSHCLSGYLVPKLVCETAGMPSKTLVH